MTGDNCCSNEISTEEASSLCRSGLSLLGSHYLDHRFRVTIANPNFPCLGAKSALARNNLTIFLAKSLDCSSNDIEIHTELLSFVSAYHNGKQMFRSFVVVFEGPVTYDEVEFERCMWERLQSFAVEDVRRGYDYDPRVSPDPKDPNFSVSFGGDAFFVVGLHPQASRPSRRFEVPAMVFNLHDQFVRLRNDGRYEKLREAILARDFQTSGSLNPMVARFGEISAARQYSGRITSEDWQCPFSDPRSSTLT